MTREELEKTEWAKGLKGECPSIYEEILDTVMSPTMEAELIPCSDSWLEDEQFRFMRGWAIGAIVGGEESYNLSYHRTKKAALALCREMGWKVKR